MAEAERVLAGARLPEGQPPDPRHEPAARSLLRGARVHRRTMSISLGRRLEHDHGGLSAAEQERHQDGVDLVGPLQARKVRRTGIVSRRAPAIELARCAAMPCMSAMSSSPTITSVGQRTSPRRSLIGGSSTSCSSGSSPLWSSYERRIISRTLDAQRRVDVLGLAARPVDPLPQARLRGGLEIASLERLLLGAPARAGCVGPGPPGQSRCDQHEPVDEIGAQHRELERDAAAERGADDGRRAVEQRLDVTRVGEWLRAHRALPEPAQVGRQRRRIRRRPAQPLAAPTCGCRQCRRATTTRCSGRPPRSMAESCTSSTRYPQPPCLTTCRQLCWLDLYCARDRW